MTEVEDLLLEPPLLTHVIVAEVHHVLEGVSQLLSSPDTEAEMAELWLVRRDGVPGDGLDDVGGVAGGARGDQRGGREVEHVLVESDGGGRHGRLLHVVRREKREDCRPLVVPGPGSGRSQWGVGGCDRNKAGLGAPN